MSRSIVNNLGGALPAASGDGGAFLPPVPAGGRWLVGVSGGADSVALARHAAATAGGRVVFAHLDHQLRGEASDADARFVADLARRLGVPVEVGYRDAIERAVSPWPANASARYRAARFAFFTTAVERHDCVGVLLAHHADDQAETVLLRLLRGRGLLGLGGMAADTNVVGVRVVRPLLDVRRDALRAYLHAAGQPWREDASNASTDYRRNVARRLLARNASWTPLLLRVAAESRALRARVAYASTGLGESGLGESFETRQLRTSAVIAEFAVRQWLIDRGAPADRVSVADCRRLIEQATNVTRPSRQHYAGGLLVRRRAGRVDVIPSPAVQSPQSHGQETD